MIFEVVITIIGGGILALSGWTVAGVHGLANKVTEQATHGKYHAAEIMALKLKSQELDAKIIALNLEVEKMKARERHQRRRADSED